MLLRQVKILKIYRIKRGAFFYFWIGVIKAGIEVVLALTVFSVTRPRPQLQPILRSHTGAWFSIFLINKDQSSYSGLLQYSPSTIIKNSFFCFPLLLLQELQLCLFNGCLIVVQLPDAPFIFSLFSLCISFCIVSIANFLRSFIFSSELIYQ